MESLDPKIEPLTVILEGNELAVSPLFNLCLTRASIMPFYSNNTTGFRHLPARCTDDERGPWSMFHAGVRSLCCRLHPPRLQAGAAHSAGIGGRSEMNLQAEIRSIVD